ncbi:MAG TPA: FtsX-like permease family protein [Terriglobales bacterium]|nr:FtsX-like permease family protein [Terriglobales bacterium]
MMTIWRSFYLNEGSSQSAQRLITRHKVSLVFFLPAFYREKIRALPGVQHVVNETWSPRPTKTESEHAFQLNWIAMLGNVKAFILSICVAVVFATLVVSATTMAMSIRERTREVALLKTLGFTLAGVLTLFVCEGIALALSGGLLGALVANGIVALMARSPQAGLFLAGIKVTPGTMLVALSVAAFVGFLSTFLPSYRASQTNIVDGLRHVG